MAAPGLKRSRRPTPDGLQNLRDVFIKDGAEAVLMLIADLTAPYTPKHFFEARALPVATRLTRVQELQGMADGLDGAVSYNNLLQMQMFPELIKAHCSMFGAWGPALSQCVGAPLHEHQNGGSFALQSCS